MIGKYKILFIAIIASFIFSTSGVAQYADLVGKWVKINGPKDFENIGVALDKATCDILITVLEGGNKEEFDKVLELFEVLRIKNHTSAFVLDTQLFEGKAKVVILEGLQRGFTVWIPLKWLDGNEKRPLFSDS